MSSNYHILFHDPFSIFILRFFFFSTALFTVPVIIFQIFTELYFCFVLQHKVMGLMVRMRTCMVCSGLNSNICERWVTKDFQNKIHMQDINQGVFASMNSTVTGHTPWTDHNTADWITHIVTLLTGYLQFHSVCDAKKLAIICQRDGYMPIQIRKYQLS